METATRSNQASLQLNPQVILTWLRHQLAEVQAQWTSLPATLQTVLGQARTQLRTALDVPTREELSALTARLSELDAKLAALTVSQRPAIEVVTPAATPAGEEPIAAAPASTKSTKQSDEKRSRKH